MAIVGFHDTSIPPRMEKAKTLALKRESWRRRTAVWALSLATVLAGCSSDPPETALRAQLAEMQTSASEGRIGDFMDAVSDDFVGNQGMDHAALRNLLRAQMLGKSRIGVTSGPVQIELHGEKATVAFSAVLTGGRGRLMPDSTQSYSITSGWRLEQGQWRVYYADWEPHL